MTLSIFIIFVCYLPIIGMIFPRLGAGFNSVWILFYLLFTSFILEAFMFRRIKTTLINRWIITITIYSVVVCLSVAWSKYYSFQLIAITVIFVKLFVPFTIAVIALNLFYKKDYIIKYARNIIFASVILSVIAIAQFIVGIVSGTPLRATSTVGNPNGLAIILVLTMPWVLYCIEKDLIPKKAGLLAASTLLVAVVLTFSRKGLATMGFACVIYYLFKQKFKMIALITLPFILILAILFVIPVTHDRFFAKDLKESIDGKHDHNEAGIKMFLTRPLIGLGIYGFYENFQEFHPFWTPSHKEKYVCHNIYISVLAEQGLLGFIPFISIFLYPIFCSLKRLMRNWENDNSDMKDMAIICICTSLPFMISGYFSGGLHYNYAMMSLVLTQLSLAFQKEFI